MPTPKRYKQTRIGPGGHMRCERHGEYIALGTGCPVCEGRQQPPIREWRANPDLVERALRRRPPSGPVEP